jgi:hypothetical protein
MSSFVYSRRLLGFLLDFYFSGGMTGDYDKQLVKIGGRNWGFEQLSAMRADTVRAVEILEYEEKIVVALRHSGHTFYEIRNTVRIRKLDAINIYQGAIIRMLIYLNGPLSVNE